MKQIRRVCKGVVFARQDVVVKKVKNTNAKSNANENRQNAEQAKINAFLTEEYQTERSTALAV